MKCNINRHARSPWSLARSRSSKFKVASFVEPVSDAAEVAQRDGALVGIAWRAALLTAAQTRRDVTVVQREVALHNPPRLRGWQAKARADVKKKFPLSPRIFVPPCHRDGFLFGIHRLNGGKGPCHPLATVPPLAIACHRLATVLATVILMFRKRFLLPVARWQGFRRGMTARVFFVLLAQLLGRRQDAKKLNLLLSGSVLALHSPAHFEVDDEAVVTRLYEAALAADLSSLRILPMSCALAPSPIGNAAVAFSTAAIVSTMAGLTAMPAPSERIEFISPRTAS